MKLAKVIYYQLWVVLFINDNLLLLSILHGNIDDYDRIFLASTQNMKRVHQAVFCLLKHTRRCAWLLNNRLSPSMNCLCLLWNHRPLSSNLLTFLRFWLLIYDTFECQSLCPPMTWILAKRSALNGFHDGFIFWTWDHFTTADLWLLNLIRALVIVFFG